MDINKNSYIFTFAFVMVVVVGILLSVTAISLKPLQDENVKQEKMQQILASIKVDVSRAEAEKKFNETIVKQVVVKADGSIADGAKAFNIDLAKELKKDDSERLNPLYVAEFEGNTYYIIPLRGKGLWGPIWGYISLKSDYNTVFGANFDHKGETPGLGAEITKDVFASQFNGKKVMDGSDFKSVSVVKGGASGQYEVDGISGGTITSQGVNAMLYDCIENYVNYFKSLGGNAQASL